MPTFRRFINRRMKWEKPVVSTGPNIIADLWQDFEFTTLNATNLALHDHAGGLGTWTVTDASSKLSTSTNGQQSMISTVNGVADTGTRGLARDLSGGNTATIDYVFSSAKNAFSAGFWVKTVPLSSFSNGWTLFWWGEVQGGGGFFATVAQQRNQGSGDPEVGGIGITEGNTYWVEIFWQRNGSSSITLRNTSGGLVGSRSFTGFDGDATFFRVCSGADNLAQIGYIDNVVMNWTTPVTPYGP